MNDGVVVLKDEVPVGQDVLPAVKDAKLLLAYANETGLALTDDVTRTIVDTERLVATRSMTVDQEVASGNMRTKRLVQATTTFATMIQSSVATFRAIQSAWQAAQTHTRTSMARRCHRTIQMGSSRRRLRRQPYRQLLRRRLACLGCRSVPPRAVHLGRTSFRSRGSMECSTGGTRTGAGHLSTLSESRVSGYARGALTATTTCPATALTTPPIDLRLAWGWDRHWDQPGTTPSHRQQPLWDVSRSMFPVNALDRKVSVTAEVVNDGNRTQRLRCERSIATSW